MPNYRYKAYDRQGRAIEGQMQAENRKAVSLALTNQGFVPVAVAETGKGKSLIPADLFGGRVKLEEINVFTRQLWTMIRAGLPLQSSLVSLRDQIKNEKFKRIILELIKDLEAGSSFSMALSTHPKVFSPMYVNMIKAGEASGKLDDTLFHLAEAGQFEARTREKIKAATRYPIIAFCALVIAFLMLVTFVIPKFSSLFSQYKTELPLPTRILLGVNYVLRHDWLILLAALTGLVFLFRWSIGTARGRYQWNWFKIKVPVIGPLLFNLVMSRFAKVLSELLASGLPLLQTLELVSETVGNAVLEKEVLRLQQSVNEGKGMSETMKQGGFFSPMVVQMVAVGEQSGKMDELLGHIAAYYEDQADLMIKNLTTLIEPILIVFIGSMVLLLALGVFMPMWDLVKVFG